MARMPEDLAFDYDRLTRSTDRESALERDE